MQRRPSAPAARAAELGGIRLTRQWTDASGELVKHDCLASTLWAERTAVIYVMRRLGCPICRARAYELLTLRDRFESVGARVVLIAPMHLTEGAFKNDAALGSLRAEAASDGAVYVDKAGAFKAQLAAAVSPSALAAALRPTEGTLLESLHPRVLCRCVGAAAHISSTILADLHDQGSRMRGGEFVVAGGADGGVLLEHRETQTFDNAPTDALFDACRRAFTGAQRVSAEAKPKRPSFSEQLVQTALVSKPTNCVDEACD